MSKVISQAKRLGLKLPVIVEKDEDGYYVIECPVLRGCYTQGKTLDEALVNLREVIDLVIDENDNRDILNHYHSSAELSFHTITV